MAAPAGADCAECAKEAPWAGDATPGAVAPVIPHERTEAAEMRALREQVHALKQQLAAAAEYKQQCDKQNEDLQKQLEEMKKQQADDRAKVCVRDEGGGWWRVRVCAQ
jgi:hypothetical protein